MSAGAHKDLTADRRYLHTPEYQKLYADLLCHLLAREFSVTTVYDVPYLGGYSQDGKTVFFDRRLPQRLFIEDQPVRIAKYLMVHECVEKALIDTFHLTYEQAHAIATEVEHRTVLENGLSPAAYERALKPYIREADHETVTYPPPDLDLTPYRDEKDRRHLVELGVRSG
jgi:hypothetical protein